jgi:hypothetical protein
VGNPSSLHRCWTYPSPSFQTPLKTPQATSGKQDKRGGPSPRLPSIGLETSGINGLLLTRLIYASGTRCLPMAVATGASPSAGCASCRPFNLQRRPTRV